MLRRPRAALESSATADLFEPASRLVLRAATILSIAVVLLLPACAGMSPPERIPAAQEKAAMTARSECVHYHAHRYPQLLHPDWRRLCHTVYHAVRVGTPPPSWQI
jgi:hypothetical protein